MQITKNKLFSLASSPSAFQCEWVGGDCERGEWRWWRWVSVIFYACQCMRGCVYVIVGGVVVFMSVSHSALTFFSPRKLNLLFGAATRSADADFNSKNCDAVNIVLLLLLLLLLPLLLLVGEWYFTVCQKKERQRTPLTPLPPLLSFSCFLTLTRGFNLICCYFISLSFYFYFNVFINAQHAVILISDCIFTFTPCVNIIMNLYILL